VTDETKARFLGVCLIAIALGPMLEFLLRRAFG
jgi:hypothetical protein